MDISQGALGSVAKYDLSISAGKLNASLVGSDGPVSGSLVIAIDALSVVDALVTKVGGSLAPEIIAMIQAAVVA